MHKRDKLIQGMMEDLIIKERTLESDGSVTLDEAFPYADSEFLWAAAADYEIDRYDMIKVKRHGDFIWPGSVDEFPDDDRPIRRYEPLLERDLLTSFMRLVVSALPDNQKVLDWVRKYGLLLRDDEEYPYHIFKKPSKYHRLPREQANKWRSRAGEVNQRAMSVHELMQEAKDARSFLQYHSEASEGGTPKIIEWAAELRRKREEGITLSSVEKEVVDMWTSTRLPDDLWGELCARWLTRLLREKLSRVSLSVPKKVFGGWGGSPLGSREPLSASFVWHCPDLLSAIYLQLCLVLVDARPVRLCENPLCRTPFFPSRKDKRYCQSKCRWIYRPDRRISNK